MAKLRQNHSSSSSFGAKTVRIVFLVIFLLAGLILLPLYLQNSDDKEEQVLTAKSGDRFYLPDGAKGKIYHKDHYSLSYNEKREQADWVAYQLTKQSILIPNVERTDWFEKDRDITTGSARYEDYKGSGYTKGHMAPAGDMAFSKQAMEQSFLMSNMSPQLRAFNGGVWRELEECVRDWAFKNEVLYVVSGPIFKGRIEEIGNSRVDVPSHYFKVLLDMEGTRKKSIGFILPHEKTTKHLTDFAVSVDEVELITGFDFYADLLNDNVEVGLESTYDMSAWNISNERYQKRIKSWNNN